MGLLSDIDEVILLFVLGIEFVFKKLFANTKLLKDYRKNYFNSNLPCEIIRFPLGSRLTTGTLDDIGTFGIGATSILFGVIKS